MASFVVFFQQDLGLQRLVTRRGTRPGQKLTKAAPPCAPGGSGAAESQPRSAGSGRPVLTPDSVATGTGPLSSSPLPSGAALATEPPTVATPWSPEPREHPPTCARNPAEHSCHPTVGWRPPAPGRLTTQLRVPPPRVSGGRLGLPGSVSTDEQGQRCISATDLELALRLHPGAPSPSQPATAAPSNCQLAEAPCSVGTEEMSRQIPLRRTHTRTAQLEGHLPGGWPPLPASCVQTRGLPRRARQSARRVTVAPSEDKTDTHACRTTHVTALHTRHARIHACTHARYTHVRAHAAVNAHTATHTAELDPPTVHASLNSHDRHSCFHLTRELGWERARRRRLRSRCWPPRVAVPPPGRVSVFWSYTDQHLGPNFGAQDQGFGAD